MTWEWIVLAVLFGVVMPWGFWMDRRREEAGPWFIASAADARRVERIQRRIAKRKRPQP